MKLKRYIILFFVLVCTAPALFAQKDIRRQLREGNKAYQDSIYRDAEIAYRKAIDASPKEERAMAHFNLGNTLLLQSKADEALKEYETAARYTEDDIQLAEILHNMGVVHQGKKEYKEAIESYKQALMKNPKDDETRYNLALLLKNQQQNQDEQEQDDKKDDQNKDQDKKDQNKDQNKDDKNKDQDKQDQNKDKKDDKQDKGEPQNQQGQQDISKEAAEKLLEAVLRDEKKTQEKVQQQQVLRGKNKLEKEW